MKEQYILEKIHKSLITAKSSIEAVEKWTEMLAEKFDIEFDDIKKKATTAGKEELTGEEQIIEGVFNGQNMLAPDGTEYPVPANYASKSKLVEGDKLKLTIQPTGAFIYKQIELISRKMTTGKLILEGTQYKVLADDQVYLVLYASVTFFRGRVGDDVAIILPEKNHSSQWAAIENILPQKTVTEKPVKKTTKK